MMSNEKQPARMPKLALALDPHAGHLLEYFTPHENLNLRSQLNSGRIDSKR